MSSKMEQIIEEIEEYIDGCKFQPLSSTTSSSTILEARLMMSICPNVSGSKLPG